MKTIEFTRTAIFPPQITAGVTLNNKAAFSPRGFSISAAEIYGAEKVEEMRSLLAETLSVAPADMIFQKQVHGDTVVIAGADYSPGESDALITAEKGKVINVSIADCAAVLLYDKTNEVIAGIHSGWRGTMQSVTEKTIGLMREKFRTEAGGLIAYISPAACGDCYEVGWDVAQHFPDSVKRKNEDKYLFDNKMEISRRLLACGLSSANIQADPGCTMTDPTLHSYRRDGKNSGRMSAFIGMKK